MIDNHGREVDYLRLAVTDRCNLRCRYCMPSEGIHFADRNELLSWDEMLRLCRIFTDLGVRKIRITGGEPFVRRGLIPFLSELKRLPESLDIGITTNGTLLTTYLEELKAIGIHRLNISLDSLDRETFFQITRRERFNDTLDAVFLAVDNGFTVKVNMVVVAGINDHEIPEFVELTRRRPITVRFIEPMPFNGFGEQLNPLISGTEILSAISHRYPLQPVAGNPGAVDRLFQIPGFEGRIGIIFGFSRSFCHQCSRIRVNARGQLRTCLYGSTVLDLRRSIRTGASDSTIKRRINAAAAQRFANGFEAEHARHQTPFDSMATIGG